jgi:hypothetical protein
VGWSALIRRRHPRVKTTAVGVAAASPRRSSKARTSSRAGSATTVSRRPIPPSSGSRYRSVARLPLLIAMSHRLAGSRTPLRPRTHCTLVPGLRRPSDSAEHETPRLQAQPCRAHSRKPLRGDQPARAPRTAAEPALRCGRASRPRATPCSLRSFRTSGAAGGRFVELNYVCRACVFVSRVIASWPQAICQRGSTPREPD